MTRVCHVSAPLIFLCLRGFWQNLPLTAVEGDVTYRSSSLAGRCWGKARPPGLGLSALSVGGGPWKPVSPWYMALGHQALWPQPPKHGSGLAAAYCHQK